MTADFVSRSSIMFNPSPLIFIFDSWRSWRFTNQKAFILGLLIMQNITPCLWFDDQAEEAANFYTSIFNNSKIKTISRYTEVGQEFHKKPVGSAMTVAFEINGQEFTALNGGPIFKFSEAISFQVMCDSQEE